MPLASIVARDCRGGAGTGLGVSDELGGVLPHKMAWSIRAGSAP